MQVYHWFWGLLTIAMLIWYTALTVYIAYRGVFDIQRMLEKLRGGNFDPNSPES